MCSGCMDTGGGKEGGMNWESGIAICALSCIKQRANGNLLCGAGSSVWWHLGHGVAGSRTRLSDFTFTFHFHTLEKEVATYSSVLAWRIPGTGEPGGLPSMGSHRFGHDWSDLAAAAEGWDGRWVGRRSKKEGTYVCNSWFTLFYSRK